MGSTALATDSDSSDQEYDSDNSEKCSKVNIKSEPNQGNLLRGIDNKTIRNRALLDITSGPEVRQISKIRTVWKPDVFLPGHRSFNTFKKKSKNIFKFF